jgi:predicted GH43/DUF377 family glycosyl hydrolase
LICILCTVGRPAFAATYSVSLKRLNSLKPILNALDGDSTFDYNYNCAYLPLFEGSVQKDALLVRCQNHTTNIYTVSPSMLAVSKLTDPINYNDIGFTKISNEDVVFSPIGPQDAYGTEDPRIVYREKDQTYYLLYSAVSSNPVVSRLALATTKTPLIQSSWVRQGVLFPNITWSKSGALLIRDDVAGSPHYLFWGDSDLEPGLTVAKSDDLLHWVNLPGLFMPERKDHFDSDLVEAGPMPLRLSDGTYLMLYNSARKGYPSPKPGWQLQYNVGWAILDGSDPTKIIQRCEQPLLSPELPWEIGTQPYPGLTPNVVFLQGWKQVADQKDTFLVFYGGADSVVGVALVTVAISK